MRTMKFRVWDKEEERYLDETQLAGITPDGKSILFIEDFDEVCSLDIEDIFIIEPSTGLKDKNGKEIYENDIVKMPEWQVEPRYEVVKYNKAGFDPFQEGCFECMSPDGDDVEVIGNIHENKELLGGQLNN